MHKSITLFLGLILCQTLLFAQSGQRRKPKPVVKDSTSSEAFLLTIEKSLDAFYAEFANDSNYDSIINALEYEANQVPEVSDEVICERLEKMNELSEFHLDCNPTTISVIRFFHKNRRSFIRIALGRSKLYFHMYEEALDKYGIPTDLRFLSVIESGLRPQVKSPAGALGLWQFMYGTGKMYGLKENSYFDERMDPAKATDAACKYLKKLYSIYDDWNLALAAYNAGPGNVNKAIRRSGGKRTYWEVRPFLPKETQGYVPNFIAAAYLMTYHAEHNLVPMEAKIHYTQLDTVCLSRGVHMETISQLVAWDIEEIKVLNPVYKRNYIPQTFPSQCITGPLMKIGKLVSLEDSLYKIEKRVYGTSSQPIVKVVEPVIVADDTEDNSNTETTLPSDYTFVNHKVRKGETLTKIAQKYKVTNSQIMDWNKLRSTKVPVGKILKIGKKITVANPTITEEVSSKDSILGLVFYDSLVTVYHIVQRNESLDHIATKYKVKADDIKKWNNLKDSWINLEQRLLIVTTIKVSKPGMVLNTQKVDVQPEKTVKEPTNQKKYYTIKSGDLFNRIAQKHGLTTAQLQKLNPGVKPDKINVGQKLRVK
ncbi:MAG: LysM peptidoglycan-binding domain-containing protein [Flavobacteriia bacterium]|jgi:membrane-bound lytic murein transglycosylase D